MKVMSLRFLSVFMSCILLLAWSGSLTANPVEQYKVGSVVQAFEAKDQHGKAYKFTKGTKYLLVSFDMSAGKKANKLFAKKGADYLRGKKAVLVSNIYGMPKIGRVFALPKMRRYPHTIILADEENLLSSIPRKEGMVTVMALDTKGKVTQLQYWDPAKQDVDTILK